MQPFFDALPSLMHTEPVLLMVGCYLVGSIPFGLMLAKRFASIRSSIWFPSRDPLPSVGKSPKWPAQT